MKSKKSFSDFIGEPEDQVDDENQSPQAWVNWTAIGDLIDEEEADCAESSGDAERAEAFAKSIGENGADGRDGDPGNDGWTLV